MVRETRHLWVGNLPDNIREDRIRDHFKRYGRVQSVKLLGGRGDKDEVCATVSFMDIKSAAKAHHSEQKLDERVLSTEYHEPAAIPAPNYSRFHLGSEELSSSFDRSSHFYDREGAGGYIRRSGSYHSQGESLSRNRTRDRTAYRNGPYTPIIESVVSRSGGSSSHHGSSRSGTWTYDSPSPRYPPSTPDISYQEPAPIIVHKKHSKSRSGSDTGSNSSRSRSSSASSQSGSSTCSTASSSPASEKSCSTHHSQQSNIRSSGAQPSAANHTNSNSPAVHSEDRRPLAICVRNLPARSSDTSLKDGLYHEYKKHGKVTWVKVVGQGVDRYALVSFKKPEDVDKALQVSHDKLFFGCKIEVAPYQGYDVDDNEFRPFEAEQDEFHPKATRTLFIGNLDKDITTQEIRKHFDQFGEIIDIDIKKQGTSSSYAFCQFSDIGSVVRAMRSLDGEHVGNSGNRVKLGFGKSMHTSCVWVDGVAETVSEKYLSQQFGQFGPVSHVVIDRARGQALVSYEQITYAQQAVKEMRGAVLRGRKLQVDYASRECQESFYDHMEKQSSSSTHPPFENSSSVAGSPQNLRVFESPSSSSTAPCTGTGNSVTNRYNSCSRYSTSRSSSYARSSSPTRSRHSSNRFQDYPSTTATGPEYERRPSYRSYEDMTQVEENNTPTTGTGDIRHLQKERVSLLEQLEDCTSSGEEGTNRRRCNKHRRSQSGESSRPGTPLCDERPENLGPVEPRRPRDSRPPDPLSLPLPRFASQVLSPRPAPPSPPASPQTHSSSSDSEPSPEWEERLRSLDEKYEKWSSGSRAGLSKVDLSTLKVRHKLLELDLHELQPSEIVKSVLAKRSVFDEDSKRLENFGEKYEPREFVPARPSLLRGRLDLSPMSSPIVKSPSSPAAKGLQYPFPSHPPVQPTTSVATTTAPTSTTVTVAATEIKPTATTFLTNCTPARQFPLPKISSPQAEKCESNIRLTCTKVLPPAVSTVKQAAIPCKPPLDIKKEQQPPPPLITKVKSNTPVRRESSDDKKDESRRKSRDESVESVKSGDSVKREDTSECDKVKDSQITERRKSISEKRRSSSEHKESICERTKDASEKRRGSSETESETNKRNENKKNYEENHIEMPKLLSEPDKISRKVVSDSIERRKETESNIRPNGDQEKKKDVFGVNSEKDRRRNRESVDTSDNPKHNKKVPDIKKDVDFVDKRDKDEDVKAVELDKKKETYDQINNQNVNRHKEKKDHQDRRRDSSEHSEKKSERISPENPEVHRIKDKKVNHDLSDPRNSKKQNEENEVKVETVKHKDSERRKNSENEISKEHSLFKKVFGFAERTYGHHKDRRDSDSTAVKTDDTIKPHRRDHSEKDRKRDKDSDHSESSSSSKHKSRKSPDQPENNRHKERKHSESSEKRIRKELEQSDDHKQKSDHTETFQSKSRERKEERSSKESSKNIFPSEHLSDINTFIKHNDRRKDPSLDESRNSESDSNDLKLTKDGDGKKDNEVFFERRKEESVEGRSKGSNERRKDSVDKYFDNDKYTDRSKRINDESDLDKKNDSSSDIVKYKHERHRDNDRKRDHLNVENCRSKEPKEEHRQREEVGKHKDERKSESDLFDCLKSKDENYRYRDYSRKKDSENPEHIRILEKKKEEKEKKKDRESQDSIFKVRDSEEKCTDREIEKLKRKEFDLNEGKVNGDHDDYCLDSIDYRKPNFDEEHHAKKEKRKDRSSWPATIGCKRRLSSQDSLEIVDDAKRSKPERRDSKDSGRSSGSSRKSSSEKHKGFTKLLEEKIKEDKEREQRKKEDSVIDTNLQCDDKMSKPAIRKEKRNSGEKRKEERKFKSRPRENGTASESDLCSGDEEAKAKRQHSIFDIVDDEPAYISMYDKVKARSTKNMQKQEEEKRQEKLKEKFHQLKASRAKREEKKRSTSYDEDSDSEKGGSRRSNKLLITSSEDEACSENDVRMRARKVLCDTSEDDTITTPRSRSNKYSDYETKSSRKIISDISEDDSLLKHSTPKIKSSRNISFESDMKTRKIMSDTSEDDSTRQTTPRQKPSRIQSDESEGDLGFEDSVKPEPFIEPVKITDVFASRPVEMNHFANNDHDQKQLQIQSSPETLLRMPLCNSVSSEQPRKKSHKKKTKKKNYEVSEDGTIIVRKHSSKKEKKKSHRDDDDEKKSRKKKSERESSSNKREEKFEDIFGPLSDDSEKAAMSKWQVSQVYGSDSESERENIRKKEKKRKEKKLREQLDEAGRALEAKLLDTSEEVTEEPIKTKKKKRKKSRDEKIKHHRVIDEETLPPLFSASIEHDSTSEYKRSEPESVIKESEPEAKQETERETDVEKEEDESKMETDSEENVNKEDISLPRQHSSSLSSLLDSPPAQLTPTKKPDIPGFGTEVDETIHETAVKSISESTIEDSPVPQDKFDEKPKQEDVTTGEKPTPIISQEETEDAVAALLMEETFGSSFERYSDDAAKPDTPVSEPDLQIDTDTEDTFDPIDFSKATKSPEPTSVSFCPNNDTREGLEERIMSLACSTEPSIKEQEKTQTIFPDVKKDTTSDKTDSETDHADQPSEKPKSPVVKSPVIENNKSEEPVKSVSKDPIPLILNEDKPIEIDDDEELETSKGDKNTSSDKLESSTSSLDTVKSSGSIEMSDKVIKIDVKEVQGNKKIDDQSHATFLTQSEKHENQQQPQLHEHIQLPQNKSPQLLQNQQKEELIQQKEVLQKPPQQQLQKPQQPQQLPSFQPQLPLAQPLQVPQQLQNQHQPQPLPMQQKQPIQPQQLHHSQHQPHLHKPQIHQQQQQVIKPVLQEKHVDQPSNTPSIVSPNFQKSEKVIHQQVMPQHHNTVLVHQAQAQPQTAQVVKPLSVQVINSPVIKSLDQSVVKHTQPTPKLNSPPGIHMPQTTATTVLQPKPPLHHIPSYQGRMPNPLPHLIPPHLPVKPTGQISLQAPQLTPLVKAGLATSPRPLPVHTIQNPLNQKQLHVVTQNLQHSPQPPVSPQNLKVIRPVQNPNIRSPLPQQQLSSIRPPTAPIPLLQTVNTSDSPLSKQYHIRPPQHLPNTHLLHCSPSQVPHPEKVMNLSPSLPTLPIQNAPVALTQKGANISAIKTNETISKSPFQPENNIEKQNNIRSVEFNPNVQESKSILQSPKIQINSNELSPLNDGPLPLKKATVDEVQQIRPPLIESKPNTKTNIDENKPLNAVIQDLTLRATNKVLSNPNPINTEIKSETPRPIDQVVRELQQRKKSVSASGECEKSSCVTETKIKEENEESSIDLKSNTNSSLKQEEPVKKEPLLIPEENKKCDEPLKTEVKEEKGDQVTAPKVEEIEIPRTPPNVKLELKQQLSPHIPELKTPKSLKEPEAEIPSSDERVIPSEKSIPPSGSGRGRGGRRRKLGRGGASGVTTRRGGRHATATVSSPAPPARPQVPADVYEFRDDSEEERPRLILTIKPEQPSQSSSSIVPSTRKSRRLQEKDGTRTMIDDSVEEIIRGPGRPSRRATRSTAPLLSTPVVETTRKSPRRKQAVAIQQASADRSPTPQPVPSPQNPPTPQPGVHTQQTPPITAPEPPVAALISAPPQAPALPSTQPPVQPALQKQSEPEVVQTPQQLVQKEPPKLLSAPRSQPQNQTLQNQPPQNQPLQNQPPQNQPLQNQTQPQQPVLQQPQQQQQQQQPMPLPLPQPPIISQVQQIVKPIHKLTPLSKPEIKVGPIMQHRPGGEPTNLIDPVTGLLIPMREGEEGQYIPVAGGDNEAPPEKRMRLERLEDGVTKAPVAAVRPSVVRPPQHSPHSIPKPASPPRLPQKPVVNSTIPRPPKAHLLQAVAAERANKIMPRPRLPKLVPPQAQPIQAPKPPTPMTPKAHILQAIGNAAQAREGVIGSPAPHQGSILTGSVASPPLRVHPQPIVTGASSARFVERPGGRLAPEGGCIVVPSASPQPPPRGQVMQAGLPVPAYEASLHGVVAELLPNPQWPRQQSPPPAHQHSTQTQGDVVQHVSGYGHHIQPAHYVHPQLMYQQYLREAALGQSPYHRGPAGVKEVDDPVVRGSPPLELRRRASPHDRTTDSPQVATLYGRPHLYPPPPAHRPAPATRHQVATPPHASQVPPQGDSLLVLLQRYPVMWQGLLALKNDQAAVQMHFVFGNPHVARDSLPCNSDGSTPPLRISQRMRLEQTQLDGVARKMQMDNEHCMLLALPCGRDHMDVLQQSNNLQSGFITYLQQKQAAGIVNIAAPGSQQAAYVVHIFPASEFANDSLARIAPDLLHRVTDIAHLLIVIATV
ncbi:protein split ends isoform X3 [Halyomorpha halys]|uniref:protein split ends isoform X3 n=1 Tax=Halyomorpha halys TaxID=286706 RepID=UPI000D0C8A6D|nr:protein split ends isoform X3 [Halyomorpha halys]